MKKSKKILTVTNNVIVAAYSKGTSTETNDKTAEAGGGRKVGFEESLELIRLVEEREKRQAQSAG